MKKLISLCLAICLLLSMVGCKGDSKKEKQTDSVASTITPLLYQVTDEAGHKIWLFGSIHVGRKNFYPLPDYVTDAFQQAEALAVEFDIRAYEKDLLAAAQDMSLLLYTDGSTIRDHIDPALYEDAAALLEDAPIPGSMLDRYTPAMWWSLIESLTLEDSALDTQLGVDLHMIDAAYKAEKPVLSIESASFQYSMLADFSPELQEFLLRSTVTSVNNGLLILGTEQLVDLWAKGDEEALSAVLNAEQMLSDEEAVLYEEYEQAMITDRNIFMADYAENALKEGTPIMICVGAAHVVGEGAIAQLLQQRGYTVTKLSPN